MAGLKDLKTRIHSLHNTKKVTSAMGRIANARLRKAVENKNLSTETVKILNNMKKDFISYISSDNIFLGNRVINTYKVKVLYIVFSSDKGFCGAMNNNVIKTVLDTIRENLTTDNIDFIIIGKKALNYAKNHEFNILKDFSGHQEFFDINVVRSISEYAVKNYISQKYSEVKIIYAKAVSMLEQRGEVFNIFPFEKNDISQQDVFDAYDYIVEPDISSFLNEFVRIYLENFLFYAYYDTYLSEQMARITAMDNAANNCDKLIDKYRLLMNRKRQSAITSELMEVIAGKESLSE